MARRNRRRGTRLGAVVAALVLAATAYCTLISWEDKTGGDLGIPAVELPSSDFLQDVLDEFSDSSGDLDEPEPGGGAPVDSGELADAKLSVHFLDVGQAECILIRAPGGNLLIDAGENGAGDDILRYLDGVGVRKLDYVIGTHPHADHIGGLDEVIKSMPVDHVILPTIPDAIVPTTQTYTDLLLAIANQGLKITPATVGNTVDLGDGAVLTILGPVAEYNDLNNMSVVCRLVYSETSFLFTADAETEAENDILDRGMQLRSDVFGVGHHGSSTSNSEAFLDRVRPRIAVISCGIENSYGHPHREVMERLDAREIQVLRTDLNGAVVVRSDGQRLAVATEK